LEKQGRLNKKGHEVYEILVDDDEADVVRIIFDRYVNEGYGAQRLIRYLIEKGIYNRKGVNFTNTTLIQMIKNVVYTGVLRSGETRSDVFPELQIISVQQFERAQEICANRTKVNGGNPANTRSKALVAGLVYCAHCGSKLVLSYSGARGTKRRAIRYICHYRVRYPQDCDGQSGYASSKLDPIIDKIVRVLFEHIKATPREDILKSQYEEQVRVANIVLKQSGEKHEEKSKEMELYKAEVKNAIAGTSRFSMEILNELIIETKEQIDRLEGSIVNARGEIDAYEQLADQITKRYDDVVSWAELFGDCTMEAKKVIVSQLFSKVTVNRDYNLEIDLNVSYKMFCDVLAEIPLTAVTQEREKQ